MMSKKTKIRIFKSNVLSVLLLGPLCCSLGKRLKKMLHEYSKTKNSAHLLAKQFFVLVEYNLYMNIDQRINGRARYAIYCIFFMVVSQQRFPQHGMFSAALERH